MFFARLAAPEIASEGKQLHKAMTRRMSGIGIAPRLTWNVIVGAPMKRAFIGIAITCSLVGCGISQQQEIQMGQEYAQQINANYRSFRIRSSIGTSTYWETRLRVSPAAVI